MDVSFAAKVRAELCAQEHKSACCALAFCYGLWLFSKCLTRDEAVFLTENAVVANLMMTSAAQNVGAMTEMTYAITRRNKPIYAVRLSGRAERERMLSAFGYSGNLVSLKMNRAIVGSHCLAPFLRGAFLACATVTDPAKEYHMEFSTHYKGLSEDFSSFLREDVGLGLTPAITNRKGKFLVYLKESRQIEDMLTLLGATAASMSFMQVKMYKEAKNDINRKVNFETANIDRTYSASARQVAAIAWLIDAGKLDDLPQDLQRLARFRVENPQMSLRELSECFNMTRSGIDHRIKKLLKFAQEKGMQDE